MTTHWFLLADYMDLEANLLSVPRQLPTLSKRNCRIILRNIYSSFEYSQWLSKVWKARCEKVSKQGVKSLAASLSVPRDLLHAYPWKLCAWLEENTHVAHTASKHSLLQAGVFRATGENQSPQFKKKTPLHNYFSFLLLNTFAEKQNSCQSHKHNCTRVEGEHMPGWRCVHTSGDHFLMS